MQKICVECGYAVRGCVGCVKYCPLCGGAVEKMDIVRQRELRKLLKNGNKNN